MGYSSSTVRDRILRERRRKELGTSKPAVVWEGGFEIDGLENTVYSKRGWLQASTVRRGDMLWTGIGWTRVVQVAHLPAVTGLRLTTLNGFSIVLPHNQEVVTALGEKHVGSVERGHRLIMRYSSIEGDFSSSPGAETAIFLASAVALRVPFVRTFSLPLVYEDVALRLKNAIGTLVPSAYRGIWVEKKVSEVRVKFTEAARKELQGATDTRPESIRKTLLRMSPEVLSIFLCYLVLFGAQMATQHVDIRIKDIALATTIQNLLMGFRILSKRMDKTVSSVLRLWQYEMEPMVEMAQVEPAFQRMLRQWIRLARLQSPGADPRDPEEDVLEIVGKVELAKVRPVRIQTDGEYLLANHVLCFCPITTIRRPAAGDIMNSKETDDDGDTRRDR